MPVYKTPGVYVEEISTLPPSVAEVATAVPAFIGYSEVGPADDADPVVARITSLLEFKTLFGRAQRMKWKLSVDAAGPSIAPAGTGGGFTLYYAISHYFKNGGGPCYVASVGSYAATPSKDRYIDGLAAIAKEDEPTLLVLTDAASTLTAGAYLEVCAEALGQCQALGDRFTILDVPGGKWDAFRNDPSLSANLMYGAAYHPYLQTTLAVEYNEGDVTVLRTGGKPSTVSGSLILGGATGLTVSFTGTAGSMPAVAITAGAKGAKPGFALSGLTLTLSDINASAAADIATAWTTWKMTNNAGGFDVSKVGDGSAVVATADAPAAAISLPAAAADTLASVKASNNETSLYSAARLLLDAQRVVLPPSAAVAGIYARVDRDQGVWKAPGNVGVLAVLGPVSKVTNDEQDRLNVDDTAGKSINAIRAFTGKGTLVWGARTLAGNDNEWRYVSVRRLFITIEESARKATSFAVFEANDATTWLKVKAMIESYLYGLWERGALAGPKPEAAYYVNVGLGSTMTPQDVLEGRMVVEIGVAAVRPAEFIVLRFSHMLQTE